MMGTRSVVEASAEAACAGGTVTVIGGHDSPAEVSWADLHHRARRTAGVLRRQGLTRGSRVGIVGETSIGVIAAIQAVWLSGAAVTVLPPPVGYRKGTGLSAFTRTIADARLDMLLVDGDASAAAAALTGVTAARALSDVETRAAAEPPCGILPPDPADLAVLQYTSGSTSQPRGVPVTHAHLAANIDAIKTVFKAGDCAPIRMMSWLPLHHDMGLIGFLALPMSCGWPLVLQRSTSFALRPAAWFEAISRYRISATAAPNFAYRLMTQLLEAGMRVDLRSVRFMLTGGEPIDATVMTRFIEAAMASGLDSRAIVAAYGLAEATLAVAVSPPGGGLRLDTVDAESLERDGRARRATAHGRDLVRLGPTVPGTRLRIVDPNGRQLDERQVGRVEVQGPAVAGHYWGCEPPPPGSWLDTGDLGYLAEGELVVCGRRKDVLFAAGRNVYPQDIEATVARVPGVRPGGVTAFGIPDAEGDRQVVAVESRGADVCRLRRDVAAAVIAGAGMTPAEVVTLAPGRLPKTSSGKLRRAEAKRRYLCGELASQGRAAESGRTVP